jgi:hypothetical protein
VTTARILAAAGSAAVLTLTASAGLEKDLGQGGRTDPATYGNHPTR